MLPMITLVVVLPFSTGRARMLVNGVAIRHATTVGVEGEVTN